MSLKVLGKLLDAAETGDAAAMEAVEAHIRTCAACRSEANETGDALQGLRRKAGGEHPSPEQLAELLGQSPERRLNAHTQHVQACESCQADLSLLRDFDQPGEASPAPPPDAAQRIWAALQLRQMQRVAVVVALVGRRAVVRARGTAVNMAAPRRDGGADQASEERTVGDWRVQLDFAPCGGQCSIRLKLTPLVESDWMPMILLAAGDDGRELQRLSPVGDVVSLPPQPPGRYTIRLLGPTREELGAIPLLIEAPKPRI